MSGRPRNIPSYGRHKASGQAVVCINGRYVYLGKYATPESYEKYHWLIAEFFPKGPNLPAPAAALAPPTGGYITVVELVAAYWQHAKTPTSKATTQAECA